MARIIRNHVKSFNSLLLPEELEALSVAASPEWRGFERVDRVRLDPVRKVVSRKVEGTKPPVEVIGEAGEIGIISIDPLSVADVTLLDSILSGHDWTIKSRAESSRETDEEDLDDVDTKFTTGLELLNQAERDAVIDKVIRLVLRDHGKQP